MFLNIDSFSRQHEEQPFVVPRVPVGPSQMRVAVVAALVHDYGADVTRLSIRPAQASLPRSHPIQSRQGVPRAAAWN